MQTQRQKNSIGRRKLTCCEAAHVSARVITIATEKSAPRAM